ncbi:hypothetical protein [Pseudomonas sp. HLMP]|uniref:hypothetical protein n=1 Tax=Pseudomonas sp. HLMP TaxID=3153767 RepID=UPI003967942D
MADTTIQTLEAYASILDESSERSKNASLKQHLYIHGTASQDVDTESGPVPTIAKQALMHKQAIPDAVVELSSQMANGRVYSTFEEALLLTELDSYFWMSPEGSGLGRVSLFKKTGIDSYEYSYSYASGADLDSLIRTGGVPDSDFEHLALEDSEGARFARLSIKRFDTIPFSIASLNNSTIIGDGEGAAPFYADDELAMVGPLEVRPASLPGIFILDTEGGVHNDLTSPYILAEPESPPSPFSEGLLFSPLIATGPIRDAVLYVENILPRRDQVSLVSASVFSTTTDAHSKGKTLTVSASLFGDSGVLTMRDIARPGDRRAMKLSLKHVPVQVPPKPVKILFIGDSIGNRQGGLFLRQYLVELGIVPTFIGTLPGSADAGNANDTNGELGECREGWETGDFTYAITDRVGKVTPGEESAYMELSKPLRWPINPFLRAATESDPVAIVRNGYVFDPAFYQARFDLDTPDIVINMLGTNNVRDRSAGTIYDHVLADDTLMHSQIKAAWPNAKIIRSIPGTAIDATRNSLWLSHYTPVIRAMQQAVENLNYSNLILAPLWAMTDPESGYAMSKSAPGADGFVKGNWADSTHPTGSSRLGLYAALAPFVAAAAINLI